jgi:uncharacterized DUF497 family protein
MPVPKPIFTWDEPKRLANIDRHKLDFVHAEAGDWNHALVREAHPGRRGEPRFKAIVQIGNRLIVVIFSPLGTEALSIISMRPANPKEKRIYAAQQG